MQLNIRCFFRNSLAHIDVESVGIGASKAARSTPMNMPVQPNASAATRPAMPVLIEFGSCSKCWLRSLGVEVFQMFQWIFRQPRAESSSLGLVPLRKHRLWYCDGTRIAIAWRLSRRDERLRSSSSQSWFRWAKISKLHLFPFFRIGFF